MSKVEARDWNAGGSRRIVSAITVVKACFTQIAIVDCC